MYIRYFVPFIFAFILSSCANQISPIGKLGPKRLGVYSVAHNDFLSSSRMLVILDEKGNVAAYSGGTVSGGGAVGVQTAASLVNSGAILYGAKALQHGIENANLNVKGVPSHFDVVGKLDLKK